MKKLIALAILGLLLGVMPGPVLAATPNVPVVRLWGQDRYQTATKIADELASQLGIDFSKGQQFRAVVLASGNNWPDAIAGAPLARQYNAPILLLDSTPAASQTTWDYLKAHMAKSATVFILGGTGVILTSFTDYLIGLGYSNIQQIGGKDRDETSVLIAEQINNPNKGAVLVTDTDFFDALSMAPTASAIILVSPNGLSEQVKSFLTKMPLCIFILLCERIVHDCFLIPK